MTSKNGSNDNGGRQHAQLQLQQRMMGGGGPSSSNGNNKKAAMLEMAAMNMSTPFYTTPDTVSSTAKTILKNIVTTMDELMDSRLRSTVSQLVNKAGGIHNSPLLFKLLSPSRNPIQIATAITRFVVPDAEDGENNIANKQQVVSGGGGGGGPGGTDELLSIPLLFKAVIDVKVFGEVSTLELSTPVTMTGKFDAHDGLLTAVDVSFDCVNLLKTMISQARLVTKTAVTKAAALSVQIAEWDTKKKAANLANNSNLSLHSLLGSSISHGSLNSHCFPSFSSLTQANSTNKELAKPQRNLSSKSSLRESRRGLLKTYSRNNNNASALLNTHNSMNKLGGDPSKSNNANATFDFGGNSMNRTSSTGNVVRFQMPSDYSCAPTTSSCDTPTVNNGHGGFCSSSTSSSSFPQDQQQQVQQQESPEEGKGNIHAGLFSWLQDDKIFLTEDKIKEQNAADEERERKLREAPMPLRFFSAAEDLGGGERGLEMVSQSIFGGASLKNNGGGAGHHQQQEKRRQQDQNQNDDHLNKRRKVWF